MDDHPQEEPRTPKQERLRRESEALMNDPDDLAESQRILEIMEELKSGWPWDDN
jgi:hypothetical protein